jgi:uncharacterized protein with HEPN domain
LTSSSRHWPRTASGETHCNFTVLGEAAAQLDDDVKARFPDIKWARPAQLRNRIIHGYWSIDLEILHTTASDLLSSFVEQLRNVLTELEADDDV